MRRTDKRELLMQLHKLEGNGRGGFRQLVAGQMVSRKLNGIQLYWDGGITRGLPVHEVPWANTVKDKKEFVSTGCWTRFGKPIFPSEKWLNHLPNMMLVGEAYAGRNGYNFVSGACRRHVPQDDVWDQITFQIFDAPSVEKFSQIGRIKIKYWEMFVQPEFCKWIMNRRKHVELEDHGPIMFETFYNRYGQHQNDVVRLVEQVSLPFGRELAERRLMEIFEDEVDKGGEGIVVRDPGSIWTPYRSHDALKLKREDDEEGTVIGYTSGREGVDLLRLGRIGAIRIRNDDGIECKVAGLNEDETEIMDPEMHDWATRNPDSDLPNYYDHPQLRLGSRITYKYFEKSPDNVPLQARYMRPA